MRFFNQIKLQTPESVELELTLAGIGNRTFALLIDYVALGLTLLVFWIIFGIFTFQLANVLDTEKFGLWLLAIALLINFAIYVGYFILFEVLWQGQTPGKRYAKIRVIRDDGQRVSIQQATMRSLLRPIDDIFFIGAILIIFNVKEKRLGDWVAGTLVTQENYQVVVANFPISEQAKQVASELPQLATLANLLPDDFAAIREYLQRRFSMAPQPKAELSLKLARQAKSIIELETLPTDMTPDTFLEAVYIAYQQQSSHS